MLVSALAEKLNLRRAEYLQTADRETEPAKIEQLSWKKEGPGLSLKEEKKKEKDWKEKKKKIEKYESLNLHMS